MHTKNIDTYEKAKDVVLKIVDGDDNELKDSVTHIFILVGKNLLAVIGGIEEILNNLSGWYLKNYFRTII